MYVYSNASRTNNQDTQINIRRLTAQSWARLIGGLGLKQDNWGEAWLALERKTRACGTLPVSTARQIIQRVVDANTARPVAA